MLRTGIAYETLVVVGLVAFGPQCTAWFRVGPPEVDGSSPEAYERSLEDIAQNPSVDRSYFSIQYEAGYRAICRAVIAERGLWNASEEELEPHLREALHGMSDRQIAEARYQALHLANEEFEEISIEQFTAFDGEAYHGEYWAPELPDGVDSYPSCPSIPLPEYEAPWWYGCVPKA